MPKFLKCGVMDVLGLDSKRMSKSVMKLSNKHNKREQKVQSIKYRLSFSLPDKFGIHTSYR